MASRGRPHPLEGGAEGLVSVHTSFLLRLPDHQARAQAFAGFVADLALARDLAAA